MKKITCFIVFNIICAVIFAVDIRQVMFGNNYESINELNDTKFFVEYPDIKNYVDKIDFYDFKIISHEDKNYYRVYEQIIGSKRFIRVVRGVKPLTEDYITAWRNPDKMSSHEQHSYFVQLFYLPENEDPIAILPISMMEAAGYSWENGTDNKYEMVEIIQRNGNVKGFMHVRLEDRIDHHNRAEENGKYEEKYINTAEYYLFDDVLNAATEKIGKIRYVKNYENHQFVSIEASQPLVDSKRPFMYTVNNAFDGNPGTAYVENTTDDNLSINFKFGTDPEYSFGNTFKIGNTVAINRIKLINGYSSSTNLYFINNRVRKFDFTSLSINPHGEDEYNIYEKLWKCYENIVLPESLDFFEIELIPIDYYSVEFSSVEIEKGSKYSDTCVSELDFYLVNNNWMFGYKYE